ncbi:hypothetical protein C8R42DRAFT_477345 [Lentinula raphanica]|nr:hypothetical protein C8R42DRAFT_477345 [Lentinula raphanica]
MPSYSLCHRLLGWFDRRIRTALYSHCQAPWRRQLAVYVTITSIVSSSGSAYASYKTNTNLSLIFAVISIMVSIVQPLLSKDTPKLVDPEEYPLSSVITTVETGGIPFVFRLSVWNPSSAGRTSSRHSPPPSRPLVDGLLLPTNNEFPSPEGGNETLLQPVNEPTQFNTTNAHARASSLPSPPSVPPVVEGDLEHAEQVVPADNGAPFAEEGPTASSLAHRKGIFQPASRFRHLSRSLSAPVGGEGDLEHAECDIPTNNGTLFAEEGAEALPLTHRYGMFPSAHRSRLQRGSFKPIDDGGYSTSILPRTPLSSGSISQRHPRGSSSTQGHGSHDDTSSSELDRSDATQSEES